MCMSALSAFKRKKNERIHQNAKGYKTAREAMTLRVAQCEPLLLPNGKEERSYHVGDFPN